jgi:hypothetical protein
MVGVYQQMTRMDTDDRGLSTDDADGHGDARVAWGWAELQARGISRGEKLIR